MKVELLLKRLGSKDLMRKFFVEHISNLIALIIGLLIGACLKVWLF